MRSGAVLTLVMGLVVAGWRVSLQRRYGGVEALSRQRIAGIVRELELNAVLVGLMWVIATVLIYPLLPPTSATVYVVIVCGSVATAAFFMSMVGRSFELLMTLQLGALVAMSLFATPVASVPLAVLAAVFWPCWRRSSG